MNESLGPHRRVLVLSYRRFLQADSAMVAAQEAARTWLPDEQARGRRLIGDPGSRMRRLADQRDRALARLVLARRALEEARSRRAADAARRICLVAVVRS